MFFENSIKPSDFQMLQRSLTTYAKVEDIKELRTDIADKADQSDIARIDSDNQEIKKNFSNFTPKMELQGRLDIITKDLERKLKDKCSETYFKKIIGGYDEKIKKCSSFLQDNEDLMNSR
jgi:hypothetical protein